MNIPLCSQTNIYKKFTNTNMDKDTYKHTHTHSRTYTHTHTNTHTNIHTHKYVHIHLKWMVQCHKDVCQNSILRLEYAYLLFIKFIMNRINSELIEVAEF